MACCCSKECLLIGREDNINKGVRAAGFAPHGVRKRLIRGFGATALGPAVTIFVQVVSVPVLLHAWGIKVYGEWLILSVLPTYLALSDVGFGSVAANDMTMRVAAGDCDGALETFQSTWLLISFSSLLVGLFAVLGIFELPLPHLLNISSIPVSEVRLTLLIFVAYAVLSLQAGLVVSGFRCQGNYALGTLLNNIMRFSEASGAIAAASFHATPPEVAATYLGIRAGGTAVMSLIMKRKTPWISYGFERATLICAKRLASPAVAFMAFPAGNALSIQGMVVVIGSVLGPVAVATFATMRTLTRFGFQIIEAIKNSVWPELSTAYGTQNMPLARKLHQTACKASLWLSLASVGFLLLAGSRIITIWTHGRVVTDSRTFHWLLLVIVANGLWYTSSVVTIASNTHQKVAGFYLGGAAVSLIVARFLLPHLGLSGAAMALLSIDLIVGWFVLSRSFEALREPVADFWLAMLKIPELGTTKRMRAPSSSSSTINLREESIPQTESTF